MDGSRIYVGSNHRNTGFVRKKLRIGKRIVEIVCAEETLHIEVKSGGFHNRLRLLKPLKNKEKINLKKF